MEVTIEVGVIDLREELGAGLKVVGDISEQEIKIVKKINDLLNRFRTQIWVYGVGGGG